MKCLFFIVFIFGFHFLIGQQTVQDSVSGGSYTISGAEVKLPQPQCDSIPPNPCEKNPRIDGFRIQVMYDKDRKKVAKATNAFLIDFPEMKPELSYNSPDFRILVGEYLNKELAKKDLTTIRKKYPSALLVRQKVRCENVQ